MNWLASNIVPAWNDRAWSVISGGATIDSDRITLPVNSSVRLRLNTGLALVASSFLRFKIDFQGTFNDTDEYKPNCALDINITYLDNTVQTSKLLLSKEKVVGSIYSDDTALSVDLQSITQIDIYFDNYNTALGTLYIESVEIYKSEDVNKSQLANNQQDVTLPVKFTEYDDAFVIEFKGTSDKLILDYIQDNDGKYLGLLINDTDFFQYARIAGARPK